MSDSSETKVATAPESDQTAEDAVLENSKQTAEDAAEANTEQADSPRDRADVAARVAEFAPLSDESERAKSATGDAAAGGDSSMDRLLDVSVMVSVELGRVTVAIDEILKLGVGSVLELERAVSDPVDLMAQGILLARGEVVVVDDRFAIRIKEIADPKKRS